MQLWIPLFNVYLPWGKTTIFDQKCPLRPLFHLVGSSHLFTWGCES